MGADALSFVSDRDLSMVSVHSPQDTLDFVAKYTDTRPQLNICIRHILLSWYNQIRAHDLDGEGCATAPSLPTDGNNERDRTDGDPSAGSLG